MVEKTDGVYLDMLSNASFEKAADEYATNKVSRDFDQGWQGIEMKLNSVGSSRGIILLLR